MEKYVHYIWVGDKPFPKLAKKCLKSWKKYLPDYKFMFWTEENIDLEECPFIKEAYENKKWAFVADYARAKAMKEYGGIYMDTDMELINSIDFLLDKEGFIGVEDSNMIACGIWGESKKDSLLATKLLDFYKEQDGFPVDDMYSISIPKLMTAILRPYNYDPRNRELQVLENGLHIYPREYFYPLSYNHQNNLFTDNTVAIHYYDASWVSKWEQRENKIYRTFGEEGGARVLNTLRFTNRNLKRLAKACLFPYVLYKRKKSSEGNYKKRISKFKNDFEKIKNNDYVAIHNPEWLGTTNATKDLFDSTLPIKDVFNYKETREVAEIIASGKFKMVIFSAFAEGWSKIIDELRKRDQDVIIKVIWHGSNAVHTEGYDFDIFREIFGYLHSGVINSIAFVKKSMYELYKERGYNVEFLMNTVKLDTKKYIPKEKVKRDIIRLGLYSSGDRWLKNSYNQLAAASLIENSEIECLPVSNKTMQFATLLGITVEGPTKTVSRDKVLTMLARNDVNLYVTFVECAPVLPLESLELGVPCITSNNHHYFEGTELEKYLIVNKNDNAIAIKDQIEYVLKNKEKIMKLYKIWKKEYDKECKKNLKSFMDLKTK